MGEQKSAAWYDESYSKWEWRDKPAASTPWTPLWTAILAHIRPDDAVLDLGCGAGHLAELRQARDGKSSGSWTGFDFSQEAVEAALRRVPVAIWGVGNLRRIPPGWLLGPDVVVLSEVLEHIEDDLGVLAQIPSGKRVILSVPNFDSEGHVRWFERSVDVAERYRPLFESASLEVVPSENPERWWYVLAGVRA